ncbi:MAG: 2-oxo acid dehydrogenase subunit E2 [Oscillospiraceae bacterium]|nr:2-oxo acid dehydrogenase subunit E2 [Oscillospiraceae bacterium]
MKIADTRVFGMRERIIANMTSESWETVPHAAYSYDADVTGLLAELKNINMGRECDIKISVNTLMLKIVCEGLKAAPAMNGHIDFRRKLVSGRIDLFENIDITMPMLCVKGEMMTVNMKDFGNKNLDEMTAYIKDVARRLENTHIDAVLCDTGIKYTVNAVKKGRLLTAGPKLLVCVAKKYFDKNLKGQARKDYFGIPEQDRLTKKDIEQGTVTVSNIGSLWPNHHGRATLIDIIPPQVCAIAIGAAEKRPFVVANASGNDEIAIRRIISLGIAIDHRAMDFDKVIPFMKRIDEICAEPRVVREWTDHCPEGKN